MQLAETLVLLPCHSWEDFPTYYLGTEASSLLAAWSAAWHPQLLAATGQLPRWRRAEDPPHDHRPDRLILIPPVAERHFSSQWLERAQEAGCPLVRGFTTRAEAVAQALKLLQVEATANTELVSDFLALGLARLQVELLAREMRSEPKIDEARFAQEVVAAAQAAVGGDESQANDSLGAAYDLLEQARRHFYPVDIYLIDLTLVASTTLGRSLQRQLALPGPHNLLISGELVEAIAANQPDTLQLLRDRVAAHEVSLIGGEWQELPIPLVPREQVLIEFQRGLATYERILGARPKVFGRRADGLCPILPALMHQLDFRGALHFTFGAGQFPLGQQTKVYWEGLDWGGVHALAKLPLDAARPESVLKYADHMSESMDHDHVATLVFAHWPGQGSEWFDDLRRIALRSQVLGKLLTLEQYFAESDEPPRHEKFSADHYQTAQLEQSVAAGSSQPISQFAAQHLQQAQSVARQSLAALASLLRATTEEEILDPLANFAQTLVPRSGNAPGVLGVQPFTQSLASSVPPLGFRWQPGAECSPEQAVRIEGNTLSNQFCEVTIHPQRGGIGAIYVPGVRGNLASQQLAWYTAGSKDPAIAYTTMEADEIHVTRSGSTLGEITARGRLVRSDGTVVARFRQAVQLSANSRLIQIVGEVEPLAPLAGPPWQNYVASRLAWKDPEAVLFRSVGGCRVATELSEFESPGFVSLQTNKGFLTFLSGPHAYHRKSAPGVLDTLLLVAGETTQTFQWGLAVGECNGLEGAMELAAPLPAVSTDAPRGAAEAWLIHLGQTAISVTHWEVLAPQSAQPRGGLRFRLLETAGVTSRFPIHFARQPVAARQVDPLGQWVRELEVREDQVLLEMGGYEWLTLEVVWK